MNLANQLATLEAWGLIHPVVAGAQVEYRFRHALVHEAAYSTLLKQNRRALHLAVGEVLEAAGPVDEETAPLLGFHFSEAGDKRRASRYFTLAGNYAARKFAHREALSYYSQAIGAASQAPPALFHARGQVYELQGFFDAARQDYERAAEVARSGADPPAEWQALLSLGLLWAARDYDRSGEYCRQAFELAEKTGQPRLVAHSYNRLGNWNLNVERPREAARCHDQALSIFDSLHDEAGMAETLDLLGMSSIMGGDLARGVHYYQQAIDINRRLGNQLALANCLGSQVLAAGGGYQTMVLAPGPLVGTDLTGQAAQALRMTHAIGWRDGESFISMILTAHCQAHGYHARALQAGQAGLAIASEIGHRQWITANHYVLGITYYDMLALPQAIQHLEAGLALSREVRSQHWLRCHVGMLTVAYLETGSVDQAAAVQSLAGDIRQPPQTIGERLVTFGRAGLARARGDFQQALQAIDSVIVAALPTRPDEPPQPVSLLLLCRSGIYAEMGQLDQAEADLRSALAVSATHGERPLVWRLRQSLGQVLARQNQPAEAAHELAQARALVDELAAGVPDSALQDNFRVRSGLFSQNPSGAEA